MAVSRTVTEAWVESAVGGFADGEAEDVGEVFGVASAGSVADLLDAHRRLGAEGGGEGADEGGAGWGDELFFDVGGVGGEAAEEVGGGGGGDGEAAVGAVDHAAAYVEGGGVPLVDVEGVDAGAGATMSTMASTAPTSWK